MNKAKLVHVYECPDCDEQFEDESEARNCCTSSLYVGDRWKCLTCEKLYNDESEAMECCTTKASKEVIKMNVINQEALIDELKAIIRQQNAVIVYLKKRDPEFTVGERLRTEQDIVALRGFE